MGNACHGNQSAIRLVPVDTITIRDEFDCILASGSFRKGPHPHIRGTDPHTIVEKFSIIMFE
jgi:hypothetical protein